MKRNLAALVASMVLLAAPAHAAATFDFIFDNAYPLSVSSDGSVVVGNDASGGFVPFRWTQAGGFVSLGRPSHIGGGGFAGVSSDGSKVASSIGSLDSSYTTQGLWTQSGGWQELMPPVPADGGISDGSYGNVWGFSGDGRVPVGLYWRPGAGQRAHASKWTQETGVVDLGGVLTGQASRANCANYTGSVIGGWVETPQGPWRPAVWVNGTVTLLTDYDPSTTVGIGEARAVNPSGDIVVGFARDDMNNPRGVTKWTRTSGVFGPPEYLGWVDGTIQTGLNVPYGVSGDGNTIIGYCTFDGSPYNTTGFIWTPSTGVEDINAWLADNGVLVDPNFTIQTMSAITPDGRKMFGSGQMLTPPYTRRAFRITRTDVLAAPAPEAAARVELSAPRPNPSRSSTRLDFALPTGGSVDLAIFDTAGRRVTTLVHGDQPAGRSSATWDGREAGGQLAATGLYFARLVTPNGAATQRVVRMN